MTKPEGPTPPEGYRWVGKGRIVWPSDTQCSHRCGLGEMRTRADIWGGEWRPAQVDHLWVRPKVTQPDLAWLKAKALEQAKLHPAGSVERERIMWAITEAVRTYSDALRALVPEREQWRPGQQQEGGEA